MSTTTEKPGKLLPPDDFDAGHLPESHHKYFDIGAGAQTVPLSKITPIRAHPEGIKNGEFYMHRALTGAGGRRKPIDLEHQGDGTYKVLDGNSTFAVASKHGWSSIPANIHEKGQWVDPKGAHAEKSVVRRLRMARNRFTSLRNTEQEGYDSWLEKAMVSAPPPASPMPAHVDTHPAMSAGVSASQKHMATGPAATPEFTHQEMTHIEPDDTRQPTKDLDTLFHQAPEHKEHLDNLIDRAKGVGSQLGMHIVEGRMPTKEDYETAHKKGGMVLMAPLKKRARAEEKVATEYEGDPSRIRDLSRATIAVSHADDIPHVTHMLRQQGMQLGSKPKYKKTSAGYQDISLYPQHPHSGHVGELQIMPLDMHQAKEQGFE